MTIDHRSKTCNGLPIVLEVLQCQANEYRWLAGQILSGPTFTIGSMYVVRSPMLAVCIVLLTPAGHFTSHGCYGFWPLLLAPAVVESQ